MTATPVAASGEVTGRIKALDGLRSLVLLVMFHHFTVKAAEGFTGAVAVPFHLTGTLGITALDVFFVLSGFLITRILLQSRESPAYFRNFYLRRALRILPLYYGFLLVYLVILPRVAPWDPVAIDLSFGEQAYYWFHLVNVPYAFHERLAAFTGHFWSLSVEEHFYLLWPLIVWKSSRAALRRFIFGALAIATLTKVASLVFWPDTLIFYVLTPARLDGLALGALLAVVWDESDQRTWWVRAIVRGGKWGAVLMVVVFSTHALVPMPPGLSPSWRGILFLVCSAWMAAAIVAKMLMGEGGAARRLAESWPLRRVGLYSYGMYILHDPLAWLLDQSGVIHRPQLGATVSWTLAYTLILAIATFALAAASWHLFERPVLKLRAGRATSG